MEEAWQCGRGPVEPLVIFIIYGPLVIVVDYLGVQVNLSWLIIRISNGDT